MSSMKWCILSTSYPKWNEGPNEFVQGKFVHDMAKYLVKAGVEVHVVTQYGEGTPREETREGVLIHRFRYYLRNRERLTKGAGVPENIKKRENWIQIPFYFTALFFKCLSVMRKHEIDILNPHWAFPTGFIGLVAKRLLRKPMITTMYGAELFPLLEGHMGFLKPLLGLSIRGADAAAGISARTVAAAREASGREDLRLIPDGIDMAYYRPAPKDRALLSKYGCAGRRVVFFSGRMVERKGHRYLLEAMRYAKERLPDLLLLLGGDGPLRGEIAALRTEWGLEGQSILPGFLPEAEIVPLLQSIDLFVLPSCVDSNGDTEGSATAAFEAMACGAPALVSRVGGNVGSIEDGEGAYYFEGADPRDLAEKIVMLLGDEALLAATASRARAYILEHYSWESSIGKYLDLASEIKRV